MPFLWCWQPASHFTPNLSTVSGSFTYLQARGRLRLTNLPVLLLRYFSSRLLRSSAASFISCIFWLSSRWARSTAVSLSIFSCAQSYSTSPHILPSIMAWWSSRTIPPFRWWRPQRMLGAAKSQVSQTIFSVES